jgi:hypothetical protein
MLVTPGAMIVPYLKGRQHHFYFIDEAPAPVLVRLKGRDERVPGGGRMLAGMAILRIVAAPNVPAAPA